MEFEDMQVIWNNDNQEKLYVINEEALFKQIKRKSASVNRSLVIAEFLMIVVNLGCGLFLLFDAYQGNEPFYDYAPPALYLAYTVFFVIRRFMRQKEEVHFEETMIGEIDKALWQIDYLIKQSKGLLVWYLLPLMVIVTITFLLNETNPLGIILLLSLTSVVGYYGGRWEINKCYMPKKVELEALRKTILSS